MSKAKIFMVAIVGALALSGFASALASATTAGWMVNGSQLTGTENLATTAAVDKKGELGVEEAGVTVKCNGKTLSGTSPTISGTTEMGDAKSLEFTECEGTGLCTISTKTIGTTPVLVDLTLDGALAVKGRFLPFSKDFATIKFEGGECSLKGVQPVSGSATFLAPTGQDERTLQLLEATNEVPGSLKVAADTAILSGSILVRTQTGLPFSFL